QGGAGAWLGGGGGGVRAGAASGTGGGVVAPRLPPGGAGWPPPPLPPAPPVPPPLPGAGTGGLAPPLLPQLARPISIAATQAPRRNGRSNACSRMSATRPRKRTTVNLSNGGPPLLGCPCAPWHPMHCRPGSRRTDPMLYRGDGFDRDVRRAGRSGEPTAPPGGAGGGRLARLHRRLLA